MPTVTLLYFDGCPHWQLADDRLRQVTDEYDVEVEYRKVATPEEAERIGFRGSPTLLVDGVDPFVSGAEPTGLSCRMYLTEAGPQGAPTIDQLRAVLA